MTNNTEQTYGEQIGSKQALRNCGDKLDKLTALAEEWIGAPEVIDQINQIAWGIKSDALEAGEAIGLRNAQRQAQEEAARTEAYTFDPTILVRLRGSRSRQEVADALDLTKKTIQQYEEGRRRPNDENIMKIARYYGVPFDTILAAVPDTNMPKAEAQPENAYEGQLKECLEYASDLNKDLMEMLTKCMTAGTQAQTIFEEGNKGMGKDMFDIAMDYVWSAARQTRTIKNEIEKGLK